MLKDKGAKAPQSSAQRKAGQRNRQKALGLKMVSFPEVWVTPEAGALLKIKIAALVAQTVVLKE